MQFYKMQFTFSNNTYTAEASTLQAYNIPKFFTIDGVKYIQTKIDYDASGEDVYGWNYVEENGTTKALIIND